MVVLRMIDGGVLSDRRNRDCSPWDEDSRAGRSSRTI